MGAFSSKFEEINKNEANQNHGSPNTLDCTPKNPKILPFDPRSPSDNVNRTPIAISDENGTPNIRNLKNIPFDPRSPSNEVTRTPLIVESDQTERPKYQPTRPSKLIEVSFKNSAAASGDSNIITKDPRSPTEKVPRTPLEEDNPPKRETCPRDENFKTTPTHSIHNNTNPKEDPKVDFNKKLVDVAEKELKPLKDVQNSNSSASSSPSKPKMLPVDDIEEEFVRNETAILNKLSLDNDRAKTNTEFIDDI